MYMISAIDYICLLPAKKTEKYDLLLLPHYILYTHMILSAIDYICLLPERHWENGFTYYRHMISASDYICLLTDRRKNKKNMIYNMIYYFHTHMISAIDYICLLPAKKQKIWFITWFFSSTLYIIHIWYLQLITFEAFFTFIFFKVLVTLPLFFTFLETYNCIITLKC